MAFGVTLLQSICTGFGILTFMRIGQKNRVDISRRVQYSHYFACEERHRDSAFKAKKRFCYTTTVQPMKRNGELPEFEHLS